MTLRAVTGGAEAIEVSNKLREDLANDTDSSLGAAIVGYDGDTVQAVLDEAKPMQSYTALRNYTGRAKGVRITLPGIAGIFQRDDADTTTPDDGGIVIVDASGRRWKRVYDGPVSVQWFGAIADFRYLTQSGTDNAENFQAAINATPDGGTIQIPGGFYRLASPITITSKNLCIVGEGAPDTHLIFDQCDGIVAVYNAPNTGARFSGFSMASTGNGLYTGIDFTGQSGSGAQIADILFSDMAFFGADRIAGQPWGENPSNNTCTWLKSVKITRGDGVSFDHVFMTAQELSFSSGWPQNTIGVEIIDTTHMHFNDFRAYRYETGVSISDSSEGLRMLNASIVACRYGVVANTSSPSNAYVISNSHFSSYDCEIDINSEADNPNLGHAITNNFFLRREDATSAGYTAVKAKCLESIFANNQFEQVGPDLTPVANGDVAIRFYSGAKGNIVSNNVFHRANICVQVDTGVTKTAIHHNMTVDDETTVGAPFLSDSGTNTVVACNVGDRMSRMLQLSGTNPAEYAAGSFRFLIGSNRNEALTMTQGSVDAVNYIDVLNAASGSGPEIRARGDDVDIDLVLRTKGAGGIDLRSNSQRVIRAINPSSASSNFIIAQSSVAGAPVIINPGGSDADIDLQLAGKNSGKVRFGSHSAIGSETVTGYIEIKDQAGNVRKLAVVS